MSMILNHDHRTCFVHIPKCGGSSIRNRIARYDQEDRRFFYRIDVHPVLGRIQYGHLTMPVLAAHFPDTFQKIREYDSYAVVRDPLLRFQSAIAEYCRAFQGTAFAALSADDRAEVVSRVINHLNMYPDSLDPEYCHFTRQRDFVFLQGERVVKHVYPIECIDEAGQAIARSLGAEFSLTTTNNTVVFKNETLRKSLGPMWGTAKAVLSNRQRDWAKRKLTALLTRPIAQRPQEEFLSDEVREFVDGFYKDDAELYRQALNREMV